MFSSTKIFYTKYRLASSFTYAQYLNRYVTIIYFNLRTNTMRKIRTHCIFDIISNLQNNYFWIFRFGNIGSVSWKMSNPWNHFSNISNHGTKLLGQNISNSDDFSPVRALLSVLRGALERNKSSVRGTERKSFDEWREFSLLHSPTEKPFREKSHGIESFFCLNGSGGEYSTSAHSSKRTVVRLIRYVSKVTY